MKRIAGLLGFLLAAGTAHADWDVNFSLAAGMEVGRVAWDGKALDGSDLHLGDAVVAPTVALELFLGRQVSGAVSLGLALDATVFYPAGGELPYTDISGGSELAATVDALVHARKLDLALRRGRGSRRPGRGDRRRGRE